MAIQVFHGSSVIVEIPQIRKTGYTKDFSWGFYCTKSHKQAIRWASRNSTGCVSQYSFVELDGLKVLRFPEMSDEWLEFIAMCRSGKDHDYDIVEGPMADDTIWNYVNDFLAGNISRKAFWALAEFRHPTHQIVFHTEKSLACLRFEGSEIIHGNQ